VLGAGGSVVTMAGDFESESVSDGLRLFARPTEER
jgi:hypothetical protein